MLLKISKLFIIVFCIFLVDPPSTFSQINTPYLKLITPNGGERWEANSIQAITWQSSNIARVKLEYSLSGGMDWHTIASSVDAAIGHYLWLIPNVQIAEVLIRISDISNPSVFDVSDKLFSIFINTLTAKNKTKQSLVQSSSRSIKIMPLGDSITEGMGDDTNQVGYRSKLFDLLQDAGYKFDFIGSQHSGTSYTSNPAFDGDHEGHGGMEVGHPSYANRSTMLDNVDNYLSKNIPDIVLFHMGTNDLDNGDDPTQIASQLDSVILNHILVNNPNTFIFWARIIHNEHVPENILNYDIGTTFTSLSPEQKSRIKLVFMDLSPQLIYPDDFSNYTPDNVFADLHPVKSGYDKMAEHWFAAMQSYYQPVLTRPLYNAANQPINVPFEWTAPPAASDFPVAYELQIAADSAFINLAYEDSTISSTTINASGLKYGAKYFWRVKITNYGWSSKGTFTTVPFSVSAKVFLQGPYSGSDSMHTTLQQNKEIPNYQPYNTAPWFYPGMENVTKFPAGIVDWVLIELDTADNDSAVARRAALLKSDGTIIDTGGTAIDQIDFSGVSPGNYYIVVKHRNHLSIMSAVPVSLPDTTAYDFTSAPEKAYGTNAMSDLGDGNFAMTAGDNNKDGVITINDYNNITDYMSKTGYCFFDDNMDGIVSKSDYNFVSGNLFRYSKVP